jgi:hypothetical protein
MSGTTRTASVRIGVEDADARRKLEALGEAGDRSMKRVADAARQAEPGMQALARTTDGLAGAFTGLAGRLGPVGAGLSALGPAGLAAAAGLGGITLALGSAVRAATEFQTLGLRTEAIIRSTGGAAGLTAQQIREMSQSIARDTLASTAGVEAAAAQLLTFRNVAGQTFERTLRAAQDLAATGFGSIESAALQLGKALENPTQGLSALTRSGVTFSTAQTQVIQQLVATGNAAEAQRIILSAVEAQVGGAGSAQAGGLAGAYDTLGQNVQEFLVRLGNLGPLQLATTAINALAGAVGVLDAALARLSGTETPVVVARRAVTQAEAAVERSRGQSLFSSRGMRPPVASEASVNNLSIAQAALVAAEEEAQRAQTEVVLRGIEARAAAEREGAASALAAQRATLDQRIGIQQTYQTRVATIDRAVRAGVLSQADAQREVTAATANRDQALRRLEGGQARATAATQRQTVAERALAQQIERGVALAQQTQTEAEKYAQQLGQLQLALAAARITQDEFNRSVAALDPAQKAARDSAQRAARDAEQLTRQNQQEAERTVERITDFFGNAFARAFESTDGGFKSLMQSFRRAAISAFASIAAQAIIRPIIAPIVQGMGGSSFGNMLGMGGGGGGGGFNLTGGGGNSMFGSGGSSFLTTPGGMANTGVGFLDRGLNTSLYTPGFGSTGFGGFDTGTAMAGEAGMFAGGGGAGTPFTVGNALGAGASIIGGGLSIYNGVQKGGIGGAVGVAGGIAGVAGGAISAGVGMGMIAAGGALAAFGPIGMAAAAILAIVSSLLPGQKPSTREQGALQGFAATDERVTFGLDGNRFSEANASQAAQILDAVLTQHSGLAGILGFDAAGGVDVRSKNSRKEGQPGTVQIRVGNTGLEDFENSEAGLRALAERSSAMLFEAFREAAEGIGGDMAGIVRGSSSMETLTANLEFFSGAYQALQDTTLLTDRWTSALLELNAPFEAAIARANELGLSTQGLADAQAAVVADAQRRRDLQVDTLMGGLSAREASLRGDSRAAALIGFDLQARAQLEQLRDSMRDLGVTGADAANALARAERILGQERLAVQQQAAEQMLTAARSQVIEAYNRESAELESLANRMGNFARSLRDFRQGLLLGPLTTLSPEARLAEARSRFDDVSRRAQLGDVDAIAELQGSSQSLLEASRGYYASSEEYFADFQRVQQVLQNTESLAQRQAQIATEQLDAMRQQVEALGLLNTNILSLADAIAAFVAAGAAANAPPLAVGGPGGVVNGQSLGAQVGAGNFDLAGRASAYLASNPDVAAAIAGGNLFGGLSKDEAAIAHFSLFGINEGRSFARGGMHGGGLRLVGEEGPELEVTGPARIFSAQQTRDMLRGGGNSAEVVQELRELRGLTRSLIQIVAASGDGNLRGLAAVEARLDGIERKARLEAAA